MKTKILLMAVALCGLMIQSCDKEDNGKGGDRVSAEVKNAFEENFPNASRVGWDVKNGYSIAGFRDDNLEKEAWFDKNGNLLLTETDLPFNQLPAPVQAAFNASQWADWTRDDVDMLQRPGMEVVYVIEVEKGQQEYDLYYSAEGLLIKAVPDDDNDSENYLPTTMPEAVSADVAKRFPDGRIIETDMERFGYEVDIIDGRRHYELKYDLQGAWLSTECEVAISEVPEVVRQALAGSDYGSWEIEDIDFFQTPAGDYYAFELEQGDNEVELKITASGEFMK